MIQSADDVDQNAVIRCRICVVGAGAAGISLALALGEAGLDTVLLEGGREEDHPATQDLYSGLVVDEKLHSPPVHYRVRRFGGSTTIWGGRCVPFDPQDFAAREAVPQSGWPIEYESVAQYYGKSCELLEAGAAEFSASKALGPLVDRLFPGLESHGITTDTLERFSCPTDFGRRYRSRLAAAHSLRVLLRANCTKLAVRADGDLVEFVEVRTIDGRAFKVAADIVVLATGGLEAPRILLCSNDVLPGGIGNSHDVVGRYYMCHLAGSVGTLSVYGDPQRVRHGYEVTPDGIYCRRRIALTAERQAALGVSNVVARLHFPAIGDPRHGSSVLSAIFLLRYFISYEYSRRVATRADRGVRNSIRHLGNLLMYPNDAFAFATHWILARKLADRKFPSVILRNRSNRFSLEVNAEQSPNPSSRITLVDDRDSLGVPRICVDWRYSSIDIESVGRTLQTFSGAFQDSGVGTFTFDPQAVEEDLTCYGAYGGHHIGTTRMGTDPRTSVVDENCKVHGVRNLYIAGSSVFPTSSQANPTLQIVALSLRLADHVKSAVARDVCEVQV